MHDEYLRTYVGMDACMHECMHVCMYACVNAPAETYTGTRINTYAYVV